MKKIISILLACLCAISTFSATSAALAAGSSYETQLISAGFPASYASKLADIKEQYPNWDFQPMFVGVDLDEAVAQERTPHDQQRIQMISANNSKDYYCTCSDCYKNGKFVVWEGSTWVSASEKAVKYYMDPLNFLDEKYIFQFETTSYNSAQTTAGIESVIKNTWMYNSLIKYKDSNGNTRTYTSSTYPNGVKYSQAILDAAKSSGLSAYYLASRIVQEVGGKTNSAGGASGTNSTYPGIYNYYNIGANSGYLDGLRWAASSAGYTTNTDARLRSEPTTSSTHIVTVPEGTNVNILSTTDVQDDGYKWHRITVTVDSKSYTGYMRSDLIEYNETDKYNRPWTNPYLSIVNGAKYISNNFSEDQNIGYLQKFNVNPESPNMYSHEYMSNVQAPSSEATNTYKAYLNANLLSAPKTFIIPVFSDNLGVPYGYDITGTGNDGSLLYLDWKDAVNADGYRVYIVSGDKEYLKGDVTDSQFKFTDLTPGWNYTVMVVAYNDRNSVSSKTTICAAPATMDGVTAKQSGDKLSISWPKETCTGYVVQWSTDSSFKNVAGTKYISSPSTTSCVADVSKWENYYVRVRAYKTYNGMTAYGDFSKAVKATILPGAVTGFDIIGTGNKGSLLYLDWEGQSNTDGYRVYIISGDKEYLKGTTKDSQFKFTDLTPGWNYNVMVVAYNENGSTSSKTTICAAPVTMTENDFSAKASGNKLNISWDKQTCTGYVVQWSMDSTFTRIAGTKYVDGAWNTSYSVTASNPQNYYVRVRAYKTYNGMTAYGDFSSAEKAK